MFNLNPPHIHLKPISDTLGQGVYASKAFKAGELIETAPVIVLHNAFTTLPKQLQSRVFNWGHLTQCPAASALALGYGSFYNHSDTPNLCYRANAEQQLLLYYARQDISAGQQLTIHYDQADGEHKPLDNDWFEHLAINKQVID